MSTFKDYTITANDRKTYDGFVIYMQGQLSERYGLYDFQMEKLLDRYSSVIKSYIKKSKDPVYTEFMEKKYKGKTIRKDIFEVLTATIMIDLLNTKDVKLWNDIALTYFAIVYKYPRPLVDQVESTMKPRALTISKKLFKEKNGNRVDYLYNYKIGKTTVNDFLKLNPFHRF